jgi:hypothetical protein
MAKKGTSDYQPSRVSSAKTKKKKGKTALIVTICVVGGLVVAAAGAGAGILAYGGAFDEEHFYTNTSMNGVDVSGMTAEEAYDAITVDLGDYALTVTERNGSEEILGSQFDLASRPDMDSISQQLQDQHQDYLGLLQQFFQPVDSTVELQRSYDEDKLKEAAFALTCMDTSQMVAPVDAALVKGEDDYSITPAVMGTTLDPEEVWQLISETVEENGTSVDLEAAGVYTSPAVLETDESLTSQLEQIQTYTHSEITYDFSDRTYVCDGSVIVNWVVQDEDGNWDLDEDQVYDWVDQMGKETDTYGETHTFVTHAGNTVSLPNGNYGWKLYRDTTTADLLEMLRAGTVTKTEPNYYHYGMTRATNDIGSSYVEVDLTNQKVYLYVKGDCILETSCVSGLASNKDRATPSNGVWGITYKKSPAVLGTMEKQGYETPVTYWMPFNGGVGLHDADGWRSSYGGSIYKTNGSHGCINLPLSAAKTIYETVSAGWPVIVYGS